jgi:hypothetical protein
VSLLAIDALGLICDQCFGVKSIYHLDAASCCVVGGGLCSIFVVYFLVSSACTNLITQMVEVANFYVLEYACCQEWGGTAITER